MAWFNEGLSSLKGQISNLTKEIVVPTLLSENSQDEGEVTDKQQLDVLEDKCRSLEQEVERLKYENTQLRQLDGSLQSSISSPEVATLDCEVQDDDFDDSFQAIGWGDDVWTDSFLGQEGEDMGERKAKELKPEDEIANLQKQVSKLLLDKRKLKQRCIHLDSQVELLSEQLGRASKVEETKPPKQNQLIQTTEDICSSADYMRMQQEFAQLREERAQLRTELSQMSRVVQDLESQVRVSQDENANLSTGLEELDIQHQEAIEQMMLVKDTTQKRYETLSAEFEGLKSKYEELQTINEKLTKTTKVEINKVEGSTQTENVSMEEEMKSNFEKKLSSDIQNLISFNVPQQYFESSESGDSVFNTIRAVIKLCDNTLSEKDNSDKKIAELNSKLQEIEGEIDALEHENMGLQASVERLNKQCESLQPISEGNEELEALDQKVNTLEKEVNILREVRSNLEVELDNARSTVFNLTHRLQSNEAIIKNQDNLQNELALVQANERSLRDELDALLKIKDSIEKENFELKQKESKDDDALNKFEEIQDKHQKEIEKEVCKNKDLELEITSSKEEIQKLRKEILLLNESCQEKEIKFKELDTTYNNVCKKLSMLEAKCSELDEVIVSLTIEKESKERKMCELILEKSTSDKHLEELKQVHENVDAHIHELQKTSSVKDSEISNLKLQLDELSFKFNDVNKSFGEILSENNNLKLQITNFDTELRNKNTEIENVQLDLKKFSEDKYSLLEQNYSEKSQLCDSLQQKSTDLEKMVLELKQTLKNMEEEKVLSIEKNTELESIQQKCIELENIVEDLKHKLSMSQDKYSTLEKNHLEKYSEVEALQLRCSQLENQIDKLQVTIKVAEEDKCSIIKQYSLESENESNKLQQRCAELETVIANFEQQLKTAEEEKSSLSEKLNNIISELNDKSDCLQKISCQLKQSEEMKIELEKNCLALQQELEVMQKDGENFEKSKERHEMALDSITRLSQVVADREKETEELKQTCKTLQENLYQQMPQLLDERDQLIKSLQAKHMEVMEYHNEIQRLNKLLSDELNKSAKLTTDVSVLNANYVDLQQQYQEKEERLRYQDKELLGLNQQVDTLQSQLEYASQLLRVADRQEAEGQPSTDTNATNAQLVSPVVNEQDKEFIINLEKERNELAENLLKEQTRNKYLQNEVQEHHEKEMSLAKELERLRSHLVSVEENYTHEMVRAEEQVKELQMRLSQADERVKNSSTAYTSASIRANQQVETLQAQARLVAEQRDKIQLQLSASEDKIQKQGAALTNLQIVLEQFQRDKERDIALETERIKQSLQQAHERNDALKDEVKSLQVQLREAKEGLNAAGRLGEQLERKDQAITELKLEVEELTEKIHKLEEKIKATSTGVEGKVDRYLVKNLLVGYLCASQQSRVQALRVLATVVDLSHEERQKVGLEPVSSADTLQQQSLSEAFVRFLENESRPQPPLRLPLAETSEPKSRRSSSVLLPDVLPNIPQFTAVRNSGSILKDVLKDDRL